MFNSGPADIGTRLLKKQMEKYNIEIVSPVSKSDGIVYFDAVRLNTKLRISVKDSILEDREDFKDWIESLLETFEDMSHYKGFRYDEKKK